MKARTHAAIIALIACLALSAGAQARYAPDEVLVGLRGPLDVNSAASLQTIAGSPVGSAPQIHAARLKLRAGLGLQAAIARLKASGLVEYAEPNYLRTTQATPDDTYWSSQYGPQLTQTDKAWDIWQPAGNCVLAIIDTGVDGTHPDLTNKMYRVGGVIQGYNALTGLTGNAADDHGHGTHCAGIAAAQVNNATGIAGVAGWNPNVPGSSTGFVSIMPVKVLDSSGSGSDAAVADGIVWATDHGARVISMSLGGSGYSTTLDNAVSYAWAHNVVVVAAAGNSGSSGLSYPGACAHAISVAAVDSNNTLASFSNYGDWVTMSAPGVSILSTTPTYKVTSFPSNYAYASGTSMATPHVAGEAALYVAQNPVATNATVKAAIVDNTDGYNANGHAQASVAGRMNSYKMLLGGGAAPADFAEFVSQSVPATMTAGQPYTVSVTFANTGSATWPAGGLWRLGSRNPADNSTWGVNRVYLASAVAPGGTATFTFTVTAPSSAGSYDFQWRMVHDGVTWFGDFTPDVAVTVSGAATDSATFVSQSVPATMNPGQTYAVSVTMHNAGSSTWPAGGVIRLGSQNPQDSNTWGVSRVYVPTTTAPGASVTFGFNVTAPTSPGVYNFQWRMVHDGVAWFGDTTTNVPVTDGSGGADVSTFVSQNVPSALSAGQSTSVTLTMHNSGSSTWSSAGLYRLGSQNPQDNTTWGTGRVSLASDVAPGQDGVFTFNITAPSAAGQYNFQWRMVHDGVAWFGDYSTNVAITVSGSGPVDGGTYVSQTAPTSIQAGHTASVTVTMLNSGTSTWTPEAYYRLGSQHPQDNDTWGVVRAFLSGPVGPGSNGVFTFNITAPSTPGTYNFQWRMVHDLVAWFGDYTPNVQITVTP